MITINRRRTAWLALCIVCVSWLPSAALRLADANEGVRNQEANFHVLLTVEALAGSPISDTHLLPTVTLPGKQNVGIAWGATKPTSGGLYVYTSFPPLGFLAPLAIFKAVGAAPSLENLRFITLSLGLLSVILLQALLWRLLSDRSPPRQRLLLTTGLSVAAMYTNEVLVAGGLVYWAQALVQPMLLATLLLLHTCLQRRRVDRPRGIALGLLVFSMCLCEWTGAAFGVGSGLLLLVVARVDKSYLRVSRQLAWAMIAPVFAALAIIVAWLALTIGLGDTIYALLSRAAARSGAARAVPLQLVFGYISSFGLLLAVGLGSMIIIGRQSWQDRNRPTTGLDLGLLILALSLVPLSENIAMMQHAAEFTYDRYKAVIPLTIATGLWLGATRWSTRAVTAAAVAMTCSVAVGVAQYTADMGDHASWRDIDASNRRMVKDLRALTNLDCAVIASSGSVRGYDNLLLGRGIHEQLNLNNAVATLQPPRGCDIVFLDVSKPFTDLSAVHRITVIGASGLTRVVLPTKDVGPGRTIIPLD